MANKLFLLLCLFTLLWLQTESAVDWLQISLDNDRTQTNTQEFVLTSTNISPQTFGKIFQRNTVGEAYAQTLYVTNVYIPKLGVTRNIIIVVTNMNNIYAFDAHDPNLNEPLWMRNLGATVPISDNQLGVHCIETYGGYTDIQHGVGILSTPYIDKQRGTIYLVAFSKVTDAASPNGYYYMYNVYGLDISTGATKLGPSRLDTEAGFQVNRQLQRPGLSVLNNYLFIAFGSTCDTPSYKGYVFVYSMDTLEKRFVYKPCNDQCGIWQSGQAFVVAGDSIFVKSANGPYNPQTNNYGTSLLRLKVENNGQLTLQDWFGPTKAITEPKDSGAGAIDFGPGCATRIPNTDLLIAGGKEPHLYMLNRNNMGKFNATDDVYNTVFKCADCVEGRMYATPVIWKQNNLGYFSYAWSEYGSFKQHKVIVNGANKGYYETPVFRDNNIIASRFGGFVTVSSNGGNPRTGVVWASHSDRTSGIVKGGILRAYDAEDIGNELWNSLMQPDRDRVGYYPKWVSPTVTEGTVYLSSFSSGGDDQTQSTAVNVYAHLAPRIINIPDAIIIDTEEKYASLKLNVVATGAAAGFTIKWYKDGMELIENQHYSRVDQKTAAVIILNTAATNIAKGGNYNMQVVVSNAQGQVEKQFQIKTQLEPVKEPSVPIAPAASSLKPRVSTITPAVSKVIPKQSTTKPIPQKSTPISAAFTHSISQIFIVLLLVVAIIF